MSESASDDQAHLSRRIEIATAVLLAVAAVATAWASYQASRWRGEQSLAQAKASATRIESTRSSDLANGLFRNPGEAFRTGWEDLGGALEQEVTPEQLAGLRRATQYAHFTPEFIVRAIWGTVTRMGFTGGGVLEPGCGTGLFLAAMPEALTGKVGVTAIEMDPCTAAIATRAPSAGRRSRAGSVPVRR